MNYIKRLQRENKALKAELAGLREGLRHLRGYLDLPKYSNGNSLVERNDIHLRLEDAESLAGERANEAVRAEQEPKSAAYCAANASYFSYADFVQRKSK